MHRQFLQYMYGDKERSSCTEMDEISYRGIVQAHALAFVGKKGSRNKKMDRNRIGTDYACCGQLAGGVVGKGAG
jgi:hypothetical protein